MGAFLMRSVLLATFCALSALAGCVLPETGTARLRVRFASVPVSAAARLGDVWAYAGAFARPDEVHERYRRNGLGVGRIRARYVPRCNQLLGEELGGSLGPWSVFRSYPASEGLIQVGTGGQVLHVMGEQTETLNMSAQILTLRASLEEVGSSQYRVRVTPFLLVSSRPRENRDLADLSFEMLCNEGDHVLIAPLDGSPTGLAPLFHARQAPVVRAVLLSVTRLPE